MEQDCGFRHNFSRSLLRMVPRAAPIRRHFRAIVCVFASMLHPAAHASLEETGTPTGTPTYQSNGIDIGTTAVAFNSSDDGIVVTHTPSNALGPGDFSLAFWFRLDEGFTGDWRNITRKGYVGQDRTGTIMANPNDNRLHFRASTDQNWNDGSNSNAELVVGEWTHVVYIKDGGNLRLYINGVQDKVDPIPGQLLSSDAPLYLGSAPFGPAAIGVIDQVRIFQNAISRQHADALYKEYFAPNELEERAIGFGSAAMIQDPGASGNALQILAADGYGKVPNSSNTRTSSVDFSAGLWFRLEEAPTGTWRSILRKGAASEENTISLLLHPDSNRIRYQLSTAANIEEYADSVATIPLNQWVQLSYVKSGNDVKLFVNGVQDSSFELGGLVASNIGALHLGTAPWAPEDSAKGSYDRVAFYPRALLDDEVQRLVTVEIVDPFIHGKWGPVVPWPHIAVSMAALPDGRILSWSGSERTTWPITEETKSATWDPLTGEFVELDHDSHNMFCSHLAMTEDGEVFVNGGRNQIDSPWTSLFDFHNDSWTQIQQMPAGGRWYPTTLALANGEMFTAMGIATNVANPERWSPNTGWSILNGIDFVQMRQLHQTGSIADKQQWPTLSLAPSGDVFHFWDVAESHWINTNGTGTYSVANATTNDPDVGPGVYIQYDIGKLIVSGSNQGSWHKDDVDLQRSFTIDLNGPAPAIESTGPLNYKRSYHNLVPLPTGEVLLVGGNTTFDTFLDTGTVYETEIFDPATRQWRLAAPSAIPRNYHSTALLLPDATVISAGGGYCFGNLVCNEANHQDGQVYSPPYLFNASGQPAARPVISSGPPIIGTSEIFTVSATPAISAFSMIRMSAVTHTVNTDVRFVPVSFIENSPGSYELSAHDNQNVLVPGYWMLFAVDANGVPSEAHVLRVQGPASNPASPTGRYVKMVALSEVNGLVSASVAELDLLDGNGLPVNRSGWIMSASAEELGSEAALVADGNSNTSWQTPSAGPPHPHELIIDLGSISTLTGAEYLPRQDASEGRIATYEIYLSDDNTSWNLVASGSFVDSTSLQMVVFGTPVPTVEFDLTSPAAENDVASFSATPVAGQSYKWSFGDGTPETAYSPDPVASHTYSLPGIYTVVVTIRDDASGQTQQKFQTQVVYDEDIDPTSETTRRLSSTSILFHPTRSELWNVNPDNDTVSVIDTTSWTKILEIPVGDNPSTLSVAPDGTVWVTNKNVGTISIVSPLAQSVVDTIDLGPDGIGPHGIVVDNANNAYVASEATGRVTKISTQTRNILATSDLGGSIRHLSLTVDGQALLVSRFITPPVPFEHTDLPNIVGAGGEVIRLLAADLSQLSQISIAYSDASATENTGPGLPNYLRAPAIHPAGDAAYVPSKQDNILAGGVRPGPGLSPDQTVRAISSYIDLTSDSEALGKRIEHDNASIANAAVFGPYGLHLFTALEGNRAIGFSNAVNGNELFRFASGRAPRGLALSPTGDRLAAHNFTDRSVQIYDVKDAVDNGSTNIAEIATIATVATDALPTQVLQGKQLFYDAFDDRLATQDYMSCASCHADGGEDGRVWDFTTFGEGLRNTQTLFGKGGMDHGLLHWSANADEVQDVEAQIRMLAGGNGLMADADYLVGTRSQPLGDPKTGISNDLDALAAYLNSLQTPPLAPYAGVVNADYTAGEALFSASGCSSCHAGTSFTDSTLTPSLHFIGTTTPLSGNRLFGPLDGIDTPTLLGSVRTGPYLHDGSAMSLENAVQAHMTCDPTCTPAFNFSQTELDQIVTYIARVDGLVAGNNDPVANDDVAVTDEDVPVNVDVLGNDSDSDGDPLQLTIFAAPSNGVATVNDNGSPGDLTDDYIVYTPAGGFSGGDAFTYQVDDGNTGTDTANVSVTVNLVGGGNNDPVANDDVAVTDEDVPVNVDVLGNDSDSDGDPLQLTIFAAPSNGTATVNDNGSPGDLTDDYIVYTPAGGFSGGDAFTYQVDDGNTGTDTANVSVTVNPVGGGNNDPVANDDVAVTDEDVPVNVDVLGNDSDSDGDPLQLTIFAAPSNGVATVNDNGSPGDLTDDYIVYTPNAAFTGSDAFTYQVDDGNTGTDTANVSVTVSVADATKFYVVDAARDDTFEYDPAGGLVDRYDLDSTNINSTGATTSAAGNMVWVIDRNFFVYVYDNNGGLLGSWQANGLVQPEGIASNGEDIWIADIGNKQVHFYDNAATLMSGSMSPTSSFALDAGNQDPWGMTTDGTNLWIVDALAVFDKVYKYTLNGTLLGSWTLDPINVNPRGISIDANGNDIWVVDKNTDDVYRYNGAAAHTTGAFTADSVFSLNGPNRNPQGITAP